MSRTQKRQKHLNKMKKRVTQVNMLHIPKNSSNVPSVDVQKFLLAVSNNDVQVFEVIVRYLAYFEDHHYLAFGPDARKAIDTFVQLTYTAIANEKLVPTKGQSIMLVQLAHLFHHLVAVSSYQNNDALLKVVVNQVNNVTKLLFLQNSRCAVQLDQESLFEANPELASLWFQNYLMGISSPTQLIQNNLYNHLKNMSEKYTQVGQRATGIYFTSTYHCPEYARRCKAIVNSAVKANGCPKFNNQPDPNSIAIITNKWHRNHAVYKSAGPLIEQLVGKYKLTLIWTGKEKPDTIVTDYFDKVESCYFQSEGKLLIPDGLATNDFGMVYFPDIGMTDESIWLSNCRIAPIQAMGYGHPETSGDGSEIDYFIGGDIEKDVTASYSETMVLIPGLGQHPAWPTYERKHTYLDDDVVRINCVWGPDKYNSTLLSVLEEINRTVYAISKERGIETPKHEFHFFASPGINRYAALPSFYHEVKARLPNMVLHNEQEYYDYMENAEKHDFSINSFPFGGYNTIVESFYLGLPCFSVVGSRFYNRAAEHLNGLVGMKEETCFSSPRDMINACAETIVDSGKLKKLREKLASVDLKKELFEDNDYFLQAVEYIQKNHPFTETKLIGANNDEVE